MSNTMNQATPALVYGYYWGEDTIRKCKEEGKLLRLSIAIPGGPVTKPCNLRCIFCFTECGTRQNHGKVIDNEMCLKFIKEGSKYAYDSDQMSYFFVSEGEPTLNAGLVDVLTETSKLGGTMTIFSNLYDLTDEQFTVFSELDNLFVCGKLYGITPEVNDYLTGKQGSYEAMMKNIRRLSELGLAQEKRLGIQCVVTAYNYHEIFDMYKWARENSIVPHLMMYRPQGLGSRHLELDLPQEKLLELYAKISEYDKEKYGYDWKPQLPLLVMGHCSVPGVNLYLTTNGDVHVCAGDVRSYGNYFDHSIETMMNSELYKNVINNYKICPWVTI